MSRGKGTTLADAADGQTLQMPQDAGRCCCALNCLIQIRSVEDNVANAGSWPVHSPPPMTFILKVIASRSQDLATRLRQYCMSAKGCSSLMFYGS